MNVQDAYDTALKLYGFYRRNPPHGFIAGQEFFIWWLYDISNPWGGDGDVMSDGVITLSVFNKDDIDPDELRGRTVCAAFIEGDLDYGYHQVITNAQRSIRNAGCPVYLHVFGGTCVHQVIDNGTRVSECRFCRQRMEFKDWEWRS